MVSDSQFFFYIGTYTGQGSEGIYTYRFNPANGQADSVGLVAKTDNPSFLAIAPNGRFLYAVNELDSFQDKPTGAVSVFAIDRTSGHLTLHQQVSSLGQGPAHLSFDRSARFLMVANYNGGNVAVFPIRKDGHLGSHSAFVQNVGRSVHPERQGGPHAHSIHVTGDNRLVIVADLGVDKLILHRFDVNTGSLTPADPKFVDVDPGAGPRHVALAPSGTFVYLANELNSTVTVFEYEPNQGALQQKQTVSTLPGDFGGENTVAEIVVEEKGKCLYVSNRGHDSIARFDIHPNNGKLTPQEWVPSGGRTPRNFIIDPTGKWLLAANQDSNCIKLFQIDSITGGLTPTSGALEVVSPVCIRFL